MSSTTKASSPDATLFAVCVSSFLMPYMLSGVGIALPSIGRHFNANAVSLGMVETGYMASVSIFMLTMGRLADIHGRRKVFMLGIGLFSLVGGLISLAWSIEAVIALRLLQGFGGAMVAATSPAIVVAVYPPGERGRALGLLVAAVYAGLSCGPVIGGVLVSAFGWRALFYPIFPIGLLLLWIINRKLVGEWAECAGEPFDFAGSGIYALAIIALTFGAANLGKYGVAPWIMGGGAALLVVFVVFESRTGYPILDVRMLRENRIFALSNFAALLNYAATFGVAFFFSLYLQYVKGLSPHHAGLLLVTQPATQAVLSPACGKLADRIPADRVATLGMAVCALGLGASALVDDATPLYALAAILVTLGVGFALFSSPNASVIMGSVEQKHLGVASGFSSSMRSLGMMASMTAITIILSLYMGENLISVETHGAFMEAMRVGFIFFSLLCLIGVALSAGRIRPAASPAPAAGTTGGDEN